MMAFRSLARANNLKLYQYINGSTLSARDTEIEHTDICTVLRVSGPFANKEFVLAQARKTIGVALIDWDEVNTLCESESVFATWTVMWKRARLLKRGSGIHNLTVWNIADENI